MSSDTKRAFKIENQNVPACRWRNQLVQQGKESRPFTPANFTALYNSPTQVCENGAESITKAEFKSITLDP